MRRNLPNARNLIARLLEDGALAGAGWTMSAEVWSAVAARRLARPLAIPPGLRVIGIGGATLGGAGKTPVAIAVARGLAREHRVVFVAHAYRAKPVYPRVVGVLDDPAVVGDDALSAARSLAGARVLVVVAPRREAALRLAASRGEVAVVDGLLQAAPRPVDHAVLVLDAATPWGSGRCPPAGDLRAPPDALRAVADHVVAVGAGAGVEGAISLDATVDAAVAADGGEVRLAELAGRDVGVALAIAHPERVLRSLSARGVRPRVVVRLADHAGFDPAELAAHRVDAWLTTERCATKLPRAVFAAPVLALRHVVDVAPLLERLERWQPRELGHQFDEKGRPRC